MDTKKLKQNVGVPRERRPDDHRVGLTPAAVQLLTEQGHACYIETKAGLGAGFSDTDYTKAGATIVYAGEEAYRRADIVAKVARPIAEELKWLRQGQTVMAFWHLASASDDNLQALLQEQVTAIAYEMIQADDGSLPVLTPMSQIAGKMTATVGAGLMRNDRGGKGILPGGVPGVPPAQVVILGAGTVGTNAARTFAALGSTVYVLDQNLAKLERLSDMLDGRIITMVSHTFNVKKVMQFADIVVGAVLTPGQRTPIVVTREMVKSMKPRSVIMDISIDQGGCVETSRPTSHHAPTFIEENVLHYCVPNMSGVIGRTATHALGVAMWPYLEQLANKGVESALQHNTALARGVATHKGQIISAVLKEGARS